MILSGQKSLTLNLSMINQISFGSKWVQTTLAAPDTIDAERESTPDIQYSDENIRLTGPIEPDSLQQ